MYFTMVAVGRFALGCATRIERPQSHSGMPRGETSDVAAQRSFVGLFFLILDTVEVVGNEFCAIATSILPLFSSISCSQRILRALGELALLPGRSRSPPS